MTTVEEIDAFFASTKKHGQRKAVWGLAALWAIEIGLLTGTLTGGEYVACFIPLVAAVMGANAYEHKKPKEAPNGNPSGPA